jgi:membrane-associated phospholipid phosphatase
MRHRTLLAGAAASFGGFLGLADGTVQRYWLGVDHGARSAVGLARVHSLDTPMRTLSILGDRVGLIALILLASLLLWNYHRVWAFALPVIMAGTGGLQWIAKLAVDRPRPNLAAWGYPSGHVLSLVVFFGLLAYLLWNSRLDRRWQRFGAAMAACIVVAVGFSRMYLDFHWLTDVVGGFALGLAYLLVMIWLAEFFHYRKVGLKVAVATVVSKAGPERLRLDT